jgi:malonate-semialdehyde dehydrogenase (acetylating)/methylmalonate-semialdehyde dehydrogenase
MAIEKASKSFEVWGNTPIKERTQIMFNFRQILLRDLDKIAQVISLENGKLLGEAKAGLIRGSAWWCWRT